MRIRFRKMLSQSICRRSRCLLETSRTVWQKRACGIRGYFS